MTTGAGEFGAPHAGQNEEGGEVPRVAEEARKACASEAPRSRYRRNAEARRAYAREYQRRWKADHREELLQKRREAYTPEVRRAAYLLHRAEELARRRVRYQAHRAEENRNRTQRRQAKRESALEEAPPTPEQAREALVPA